MKEIIRLGKKIIKIMFFLFIVLYMWGLHLGSKEYKRIEPEVKKQFNNLEWKMDDTTWFGSEVETKFKNTTRTTLGVKISYKLKDYDGTILEEGISDEVRIEPGDTKLIEIPLGYKNVSVDNLDFKLNNF
ncbi:hypothetical protein [Faecalimicrobium dakarense]|uniref:hypothetical protein n=1 Tax=Faecalimicrobium dakarense TaxID=1301100 RepID=UPI0004B2B559|nr:hypothetical protein [[Clostridium] dakarense]